MRASVKSPAFLGGLAALWCVAGAASAIAAAKPAAKKPQTPAPKPASTPAPTPLPAQGPAPSPEALDFFEKEVRPVLAASCYSCHGPKLQQAGFRLDDLQSML